MSRICDSLWRDDDDEYDDDLRHLPVIARDWAICRVCVGWVYYELFLGETFGTNEEPSSSTK